MTGTGKMLLGITLVVLLVFFVYSQIEKANIRRQLEAVQAPIVVRIEAQPAEEETTVIVGDPIYVPEPGEPCPEFYPEMNAEFDFNLFHLYVTAYALEGRIKAKAVYKPIVLEFELENPYDLRKGFKIHSTPDLGPLTVKFKNYRSPPKKKDNLQLMLGTGHNDSFGLTGRIGLGIKNNFLGVDFNFDGSKTFWYSYVFGIF